MRLPVSQDRQNQAQRQDEVPMATVARPSVLTAALASTAAVWWLMGASASTVRAQSDPSVMGAWSAMENWPIVSVHGSLLPTGKVIFYPYTDDPRLWDPSTGVDRRGRTEPASTSSAPDSRCSRMGSCSWRAVTSATMWGSTTPASTIPSRTRGRAQPDMNAGRWYPTTTTLADGSVLVVSGDVDKTVGVNRLPQVWTNGTWRDLTAAQISLPLYPFMLLAPDGRVFNAGPQQTSRYLNTSGTGAWSNGPASTVDTRSYGSAVMYEPGKVLIVGGNDPPRGLSGEDRPQSRCAELAIGGEHEHRTPPAQRNDASGRHGARHGRQLRCGVQQRCCARVHCRALGSRSKLFYKAREGDSLSGLSLDCAAAARRARALVREATTSRMPKCFLLPICSRAHRPEVTSSPSSHHLRRVFFVDTPDATSIAAVTLVRLSAVTHSYNMNQRFLRLAFSQAAGGLTATAPSVATIAPPGHYMLFVLNAAACRRSRQSSVSTAARRPLHRRRRRI